MCFSSIFLYLSLYTQLSVRLSVSFFVLTFAFVFLSLSAGRFRCWDQSCRNSSDACPLPPSALKILPVVLALTSSETPLSFAITGASANGTMLNVTVPPGAFVPKTSG